MFSLLATGLDIARIFLPLQAVRIDANQDCRDRNEKSRPNRSGGS
jgi:hypothetical protein